MNAPLNLHCPSCSQPLEEHEAAPLECRECGQTYSQTLGIPDLRGPGFEDTASDQTIVKLLRDAYKTASYEELLTIRIKNAPTYGDLIGHEVDYLRGEAARSELMIKMFRRQLRSNFGAGNTGTALDLGSGTGTSLPLLAEIFEQVVGLEPSLPECILAKKYLETNGVENVRLVQAYGQHIPFKTGVFDFVSALNVLEHVFELRQVLDEVHRTLGDGGQFAGDSRNRFDLFTPEPHVKIRWVGLLPRKWAPAYVRLRRGVGYESTYLLSYRELKRGLQSAFGHHHRVTFPQVTAYGLSPTLDQWVQRISRIPALNSLTLWVFPSHLALAHKPAEGRSGP